MSLPSGAILGHGELQRIQSALAEIEREHKDGLKLGQPHAARELNVKIVLHIHREYPKHVKINDEKVIVVNNADEEAEALMQVEGE